MKTALLTASEASIGRKADEDFDAVLSARKLIGETYTFTPLPSFTAENGSVIVRQMMVVSPGRWDKDAVQVSARTDGDGYFGWEARGAASDPMRFDELAYILAVKARVSK